jgi:hypothetical protein
MDSRSRSNQLPTASTTVDYDGTPGDSAVIIIHKHGLNELFDLQAQAQAPLPFLAVAGHSCTRYPLRCVLALRVPWSSDPSLTSFLLAVSNCQDYCSAVRDPFYFFSLNTN